MRTFPRYLILVAVLVGTAVVSGLARADDAKAQARAEYKRGETAYALSEFDRAIGHYKKAYELSNAPALLFNIAQAYKLKGDYGQAIQFYETYLRLATDPPNRADVERYVVELKEKKAEEDRRAAERDRAEAERRQAEAERERLVAEAEARRAAERETLARAELASAGRVERRPNPALSRAGLIVAGVGVVAAGGASVFAFKARSSFDEVNKATRWSAQLDDTLASAQSARTFSIVLAATGGAALATGAALYVLGRRDSAAEARPVNVSVAGDGRGLIVQGRF
jgi:tetratricopeptide (TPR) repeat protein